MINIHTTQGAPNGPATTCLGEAVGTAMDVSPSAGQNTRRVCHYALLMGYPNNADQIALVGDHATANTRSLRVSCHRTLQTTSVGGTASSAERSETSRLHPRVDQTPGSVSREVIVSKSLLRIVAVVAIAALIFGTFAAAWGSLAGADDGTPQRPTLIHTRSLSETWHSDHLVLEDTSGSTHVR